MVSGTYKSKKSLTMDVVEGIMVGSCDICFYRIKSVHILI